jgi:hypothetical protein
VHPVIHRSLPSFVVSDVSDDLELAGETENRKPQDKMNINVVSKSETTELCGERFGTTAQCFDCLGWTLQEWPVERQEAHEKG